MWSWPDPSGGDLAPLGDSCHASGEGIDVAMLTNALEEDAGK